MGEKLPLKVIEIMEDYCCALVTVSSSSLLSNKFCVPNLCHIKGILDYDFTFF